ncbi:hypothetical protein SAMN02949497_0631 [Methylomagnum ishizawai]|uniref:O-antigen ligase like membrane protein n=1 Tax=Methylomagnum ishizawai TaxID=1760988 RepID=A0A1Y6CXR8_9GAMM|nr:hypothetical protein SAMN02949497_0631 [Methylomagnum ishizawai]
MEITVFAIPVILAGLLASGEGILYALMICLLFGGTATLSFSMLGDAPILPAVLLMPFLIWKAIANRGISLSPRLITYPEPGFWLLLLVLWEVLSAIGLPRLFSGETYVFSTNRGVIGGVALMPLKPLSTNLTQSIYALLGLACFLSVRSLLDSERRMAGMRDAVLLLAMLNIWAGVLQLAENNLGFPSVLNLFRNASYATFTGGEVGGLLRIYGTFPETSAFSSFTLALFAFTASLCRDGVRGVYSGIVALASLGLLLMTTSSTAYAGLLIYGTLATAVALAQAYWHRQALYLGPTTLMVGVVVLAGCFLALSQPRIFSRIFEFFDLTLVNKLDSASGRERSLWNQQAWVNFIDTYGLGIGFGSARASSFPMALLSNIGVIGVGLFTLFCSRLFAVPVFVESATVAAVARAARHGLMAVLVAGAISGTMADPGMVFYTLSAVAAAGGVCRKPQWESARDGAGFKPRQYPDSHSWRGHPGKV